MAATRALQVPIGSTQWVQNEREQIFQFEGQENEDFAFAARNEFEWLNEHMAEIFNHDNLNVAEIFKTPGKLRGKTPRTNRKKNALEARAPLTDVFSSDIRYNGSPNRPQNAEKKLRIQSPRVTKQTAYSTRNAVAQPSRPPHHDSGYHGTTEDEMEVEVVQSKKLEISQQPVDQPSVLSDERRTTEGSFHSARENVAKETPAPEARPLEVPGSFPRETPVPMEDLEAEVRTETVTKVELKDEATPRARKESERSPSSEGSTPEKQLVRKSSLNFASLPAREPLTTKKSIGHRTSNMDPKHQGFGQGGYFGRFTGGKSIGTTRQPEGEEAEVERGVAGERGQDQAKYYSKSSTQRLHERINLLGKAPAPRPTKSIHNNAAAATTSAQTADRPLSRAESQTLAETEPDKQTPATEEEEDDWTLPPIKAPKAATRPPLSKSRSVDVMEQFAGKDSIGGEQLGMRDADKEVARQRSPLRAEPLQELPQRIYGHQKSASTTIVPSPEHLEQMQAPTHQKTISVSNPTLPSMESTTPAGSPARPVPSPSRFHIDGHLSASKSKLQSIMRSARGLFTSSAGVSAQAKMEALSPSSSRIRVGNNEPIQGTLVNDGPLYPKLNFSQSVTLESSTRQMQVQVEQEDYQHVDDVDERETADIEPIKAHKEAQGTVKTSVKPSLVERSLESTSKPIRQSPRKAAREEEQLETGPSMETASKSVQSMAPPPRPQAQVTHLHKPKESRRPVKPAAKPAAKPPQVAIRVGTGSQRIPLTNNALSAGLQDTLAPPNKQQGLSKKASNASIQTAASTTSFKSSTSSNAPKPKSLVLAAQKKEQAEKEAQRKEEEKKERERKRAAAQEEAQRKEREQRQREEAERQKERERVAAEEAKRRAQKEAADKKRMETNRKAQQTQTTQPQADLKRAANELSKSVRAEASNRPPSRIGKGEEASKAPAGNRPVNQAKPIKRVFDPENDDELSRPATRAGQNYHQTNEKRRRTGEEDEPSSKQRPTLQPPIRQSNIRKPQVSTNHDQGFGYSTHGGSKPSVLNGNYPTAPPPAAIHATGKHPGMNQAYQQSQAHAQQGPSGQPIRVGGHPMDMAKFQSGKIPFAEAPNPPATSYKTPHQTKQSQMPNTNKSSPMYANGEHIHLEEIATDSEDEDSDDERERKQAMPDWVRTPNLFDNLASQETINPDAVFGPIPALNMEEMFRDKSRHHKFHKRTSSANWNGADRLTEDDIRQDMAAREKLRQDGGWTYGLK